MIKKQKKGYKQTKQDDVKFYAFSAEESLKKLSSNKSGLSQKEAEERLKKYGPNLLPEKEKRNPVLLFLKQFNSFLIYILMVAAGVAVYADHMVDFYVILFVVIFNAIMGFVQEYRAEKAVEALQDMMSPHARVYRDGQLHDIEAKDLVPGDIVHLAAGDKVPADVRIIDQSNLRTQEASLTGESAPISKNTDVLPPETGLADRKNMAWMGTFVADGQCDAIVVATGSATAFGKIAESISKIKRQKSHFEKKADILAKKVGLLAIGIASVVFFIGRFMVESEIEELYIFALASLVSGIPEGLPAILSVVLAIGARRMAARNAIVKTLPAGETLGVADIIITDKTGTLTQNAMTVERISLAAGGDYSVTGKGWSSEGEFLKGNPEPVAVTVKTETDLQKLLSVSAICNSATVRKEEEGSYEILGDPTEAGVAVLAQKAGLTKENALEGKKLISDFPFNQQLKYRSSIVQDENGKREFYVLGAPEVLIDRSDRILHDGVAQNITEKQKNDVRHDIEEMAKNALRVLGLAYREIPSDVEEFSDDMAGELVFIGIVGMKDPARPEVPEAIKRARNAGVRVVMATGDHKETAFAIAKEIGLIDVAEDESAEDHVLTGAEVEKMSKRELKASARDVLVFARLEPDTKLKLADAFQKQGHIVAMTGDGVNDSPALKKADIGIAMGIIGTDVAREASKVILADDNFATIVNAIEEGRIIFNNVRLSSTFLVTTNVAEGVTLVAAMAMFHQFPLLATQILWLNLVTDSAAGIPLATERAGNRKVLEHPPRKPNESILAGPAIPNLFIVGIIMIVASVLVFGYFLGDGLDKARTATFTVMAFTQIFHMLNLRSLTISLFKLGVFSNKFVNIGLAASVSLQIMVIYTPFFQNVFNFVPLGAMEFVSLVMISSLVLWIGEAYKVLQKKMGWFHNIV